MCPEPDSTRQLGPLLVRRWGRWLRLSFRRSDERFHFSLGFSLPRVLVEDG